MSAQLERLFLFACAVDAPGDWAGHEDALRGLAPAQWEALCGHAVVHGFVGLLARNLAWGSERAGIAVPAAAPLEEMRRGQLAQHLVRKAAARRVCAALEGHGIPFIVFKGIVLAEEVYGDLSLRGFRDVDIMVPRERVDEAFGLCAQMGYRLPPFTRLGDYLGTRAHAAGMTHPDGTGVDLHWSFAPDMIAPGQVATIWESARPAPPGAPLPGLRLGPEMTLLHLAKHFHSHEYVSPKPLVDFFVAARKLGARLDPARLLRDAASLGLTPPLDIAAGLAERCFMGAELPAVLRERATSRHARLARRIVVDGLLVDAAHRSRIGNWARFLLAAGGPGFALRSLRPILLPGPMSLAQFFGQPYKPAMYARYYWRQLVKTLTLSPK